VTKERDELKNAGDSDAQMNSVVEEKDKVSRLLNYR
jgi:hypothetical protein